MVVKGQGGVVKTMHFFFLPFLLHGRDGCVINCAGQWGIYGQVQMEVTSDLSCGIRPALILHDNGLLQQ